MHFENFSFWLLGFTNSEEEMKCDRRDLPHAENQMHSYRELEFKHRGKKSSMLILKWNCCFKFTAEEGFKGKMGKYYFFSIQSRNLVAWKRSASKSLQKYECSSVNKGSWTSRFFRKLTILHRYRDKGKAMPSLVPFQCHSSCEKSVISPQQLSFMLPVESLCKESLDSHTHLLYSEKHMCGVYWTTERGLLHLITHSRIH